MTTDRRSTDQAILDKLDFMDQRREEQHTENKRLLLEHEARDTKEFDDHEKRLRHLEKYVWGALGAMLLLHGIADMPNLLHVLFGK